MKNSHIILALSSVFLMACTDTTGLSDESSREPAGNPNAAVIVMEFSDLQCPACKMVHEQVTKPLLQNYGNKIRFEFKHFPLRNIHTYALGAAMAAECAADQGKFWEFVDIAYEKQEEINTQALMDWGAALGLDTELYERCWKSKIKEETVMDDFREGRGLNVQGTPTFFVNGVQTPTDKLPQAIDSAYAQFNQRL